MFVIVRFFINFLFFFALLPLVLPRRSWYWEILVKLRKLVLQLIVFFVPATANGIMWQAVGGLAVLSVNVYWYDRVEPFRYRPNNRLNLATAVGNVLLLFSGLLYYADKVGCLASALFGCFCLAALVFVGWCRECLFYLSAGARLQLYSPYPSKSSLPLLVKPRLLPLISSLLPPHVPHPTPTVQRAFAGGADRGDHLGGGDSRSLHPVWHRPRVCLLLPVQARLSLPSP